MWLMKVSVCLAFVDDEGSASSGATLQGTWFWSMMVRKTINFSREMKGKKKKKEEEKNSTRERRGENKRKKK
jgi:hypothetical protein